MSDSASKRFPDILFVAKMHYLFSLEDNLLLKKFKVFNPTL